MLSSVASVAGWLSPSREINKIESGIDYINKINERDAINNFSTEKQVYGKTQKEGCLKLNNMLSNDDNDDGHSSHMKTFKEKSKTNENKINEKASTTAKKVVKKKKMTKVVASRYMSQASQQTTKAKTVSVHSSTSKINASKVKKPSKLFSDTTEKKQEKNATLVGKTSTPTSKFKTFFESDISAIQAASTTARKTNKPVSKSIDDLYARYLRWAYLSAAMSEAAQARHKLALNDLNKLCEAEVKLQQEVSELEIETNFLESLHNLNVQLDNQSTVLEPVVNNLDVTIDKYRELADNIDAVRHGLPVTDVLVPCESNLEQKLHQMDNVLKDLAIATHSHADNVANGAQYADSLRSTVTGETDYFINVSQDVKVIKELFDKKRSLELQIETEKKFS